jgi:hypothetical protein
MFGRWRANPPKAAAAAECFFCRRQIGYGERYVSLNYHVEWTRNGRTINVEQAESLLTTCLDCAPAPNAIVDTLRTQHRTEPTQLQ